MAAAQVRSVPGEIVQNVAHHARVAMLAADHGVQLLVFPELSLTGYEPGLAKANAVKPNSAVLDALWELSASTGMVIVAGAPTPNPQGELHIAAFAFFPDGAVATYTKEHVHSSEEHVFTSGSGGGLWAVGNMNVGLAICRDASFPEHAAKAASRGATVYAAGVMITEDDYPRKSSLLQGYAAEHGMAVLMANYSGISGGEMSAGKSAIWCESGGVVAVSEGAEEELVIARKVDGGWEGVLVAVD